MQPARCIRLKRSVPAQTGNFIKTAEAVRDCDTGRNCAFAAAKERIIGKNRERNGIGTLSEKTVHAVLKNYYAPDETQHEIPVEGCVADIFNGKEIIEIQTRSFDRMRPKLERFLPLYPVTIVYPIPYCKHVFWIDEETGEIPADGNLH